MRTVEVNAIIIVALFVSGMSLGATLVNWHHRRKGLQGQVRKMRWVARRDWFFDDDQPHRLANAAVVVVTATLIAATWISLFSTGRSSLVAAAWASGISGGLLAISFAIMFLFKEDL